MSLRIVSLSPLIGAPFCCAVSTAGEAEHSGVKREYNLPRGDAAAMLNRFATISGSPVLFMMDKVQGEQTNALRGEFTPAEALKVMLTGTALEVVRATASEGFVVTRRTSAAPREEVGHQPKRQPQNMTPQTLSGKIRSLFARLALVVTTAAAAQDASHPSENSSTSAAKENVVVLSPFAVSSQGTDRYRTPDALSAVRVRAPLLDTGSSISVLTREFIDDVAPGRLWDATRYIAGVQEGRFYNFLERMIIRGFQNDGRAVDNFFNDSSQNYDEALVERIEVSKGPNAILSPAGAPGGTVNVVTKSPKFNSHGSLTALAGLYDAQKVTLDLTGPVKEVPKLAYRVIGVWQDSRREWTSDAKLKRQILAPQLAYRLSDRTEVALKTSYHHSSGASSPLYVVDSSTVGANVAPILDTQLKKESRNGIPSWSTLDYTDVTANVLLTSTISDHISLRLAGHARRSRENSNQASVVFKGLSNRYDPYTGLQTPDYTWALDSASGRYVPTYSKFFDFSAVTIDANRADGNDNTYSAGQADIVASYDFSRITTQTVAGVALANQHTKARYFRAPVTVYNFAAGDQVPLPAFTQLYQDNRSSNRNSQIYINERLGFWNNRAFINGGILRYQVYTRARNAFANGPVSVLDSAKNMGLASVLLKPRENISVYASYSTNGSPVVANNQTMWSEGKQREVGLKSEFLNQRLSFSTAYFKITQTNVSIPNPNRASDLTAPLSVISDFGDHGIEFELNGTLTKEISVVAAYTRLKLRDSLGRRVRAVADETASFLVNYHPSSGPLKGFSTSVSAVHSGGKAGDLPAVNFTPLNVITQSSFLVQPYTMWNFNMSYRWHRAMFALFVDNLTDIDRITQGGGRAGLGLSPAFRRNARFSTSFEF